MWRLIINLLFSAFKQIYNKWFVHCLNSSEEVKVRIFIHVYDN